MNEHLEVRLVEALESIASSFAKIAYVINSESIRLFVSFGDGANEDAPFCVEANLYTGEHTRPVKVAKDIIK